MFFNIGKKDINKRSYNKQYFSYNEITTILQDVKNIKIKLKNYLKKNKYVKYSDNGEDYILLCPNSKFFKKYKEEKEQKEFIRDELKTFLKEELDFSLSTQAVDFIDIDIYEIENSKSLVKIIFI